MIKLVLIWLAVVACLLLRIISQPDRYTTPDSHAYLYKAENIRDHQKGYVAIGPPGPIQQKVSSSIWPIGYSFLIYITGKATGLSFLWASKLVNIAFLTLVFLLLYYWFGKDSWFVSLAFFSYSSLEVFSHTWSEGPFLFFVLLLVYLINRQFNSAGTKWNWLYLSACIVALFLLRYAGLVFLIIIGFLILYHFLLKEVNKSWQYVKVLFGSLLPIGIYLILNYMASGSIFGAHNVQLRPLAPVNFILTYINAISFARIYIDGADMIYYGVTLIQFILVVMLLIFYYTNRIMVLGPSKTVFITGFCYLVLISLLKLTLVNFDFDYRLMSPFSILLFLGIFILAETNKNVRFINLFRKSMVVFAFLSLIVNLPNRYILEVILTLIR